MYSKYISIVFVLIIMGISNYIAKSQSNINIKLSTISYQFTDNNIELVNRKIGKSGKLALEPGLIFAYESFATPASSIKVAMALYYDKASKLAGFSQVMIRFRLFNAYKHSMSIGFGPAFYFRQTWATLDGYQDDGVYTDSGDWQYKMAWLSGELEYNYYLTKNSNLSVSFNLINPESLGLAIGYKYWISKKPKRKRGCISCPNFH